MSRFTKTIALTLAASTALSTQAMAQDDTAASTADADMIIVTGTRATGANAAESAAPVLLLSSA